MTIGEHRENTVAPITVSLVSHGHGRMISNVLSDLAEMPEVVRVVLTLNVPEAMPGIPPLLQQKLNVIENSAPKGFAANHNAAFEHCGTEYFCVLNPDIRFTTNPFLALIKGMAATEASIAAPLVVNSSGVIEDSVRFFPTPFGLLKKAMGLSRDSYVIKQGDVAFKPDWVAGMCMLFQTNAFRALKGFDEAFFLYYEDVDICARSWQRGMPIVVCPAVTVTHDAQRESHSSLKFLRWHLASMLRFFRKHWRRLPDTGATNISAV